MAESTIGAIVVASIGAISVIIVAIIQNSKQLSKEKSEQTDGFYLVKPLPSKKRLSLLAITLYVIATGLIGFIIFLLLNSSSPSDTMLPPSGYIILDQFDNQEPIGNNWLLINNVGNSCSTNKQDGYLHMDCTVSKKGDYQLEYTSKEDDMRLLSGGTLSGIAMSIKMDNPNQDDKAKVYFLVHFTGADGTPSTRAYFMQMRFNDINVVEAYPLESWRLINLVQVQTNASKFHIIQAEFKSDQINFLVDGHPLELKVQPNLPKGSVWQDWIFGIEINNWEDQPAGIKALIDWIAVSTGQTQ